MRKTILTTQQIHNKKKPKTKKETKKLTSLIESLVSVNSCIISRGDSFFFWHKKQTLEIRNQK